MTTPGATKTGDFLYDSFYSGAIGGSTVALAFLAFDLLQGRPFFTPSVLSTVLFTDLTAVQVTEVRLDMVAYATVIHFVAFAALGIASSALVVNVKAFRDHSVLLMLLLFVLMEIGFHLGAFIVAPDLIDVIGTGRIMVANALTAAAMGAFLAYAHREEDEEGEEEVPQPA